ncbi:hypothetical protein R3P38DRAFT_53131 [Favolaschia claudopus]|uniref:Uncharacterized protein n=1 Tax=Favolaschia claudopus TaxID=2862362 RepID=A0AAW0EJ05_9AGAR
MSYDYHGKDWPLRVPKYWDEDQGEIVYSAKMRDESIELRKVLGYYSWIYNGYEEEDREVEPGSHGYLHLGLDKTKVDATATKKKGAKGTKEKAEEIDPAHVKGVFDTCGISSKFVGLTENDGSSWTFDSESVVEKGEDSEEEDDDSEDFSFSRFFIGVTEAVDDHGHPFIEFTHSPGMHEGNVTYIGKKQRPPSKKTPNGPRKLEGLTEGERKRLGMFVTEEEIKAAALGSKKVSNSDGGDGEKTGADVEEAGEKSPRKRKAEDRVADEEGPPRKR